MKFHDHFIHTLTDGCWNLKASQRLIDESGNLLDDSAVYEKRQKLVINGPRFLLRPEAVHSVYPPCHTTGIYEHDLTYIVLKDASLAWSRPLAAGKRQIPWMALALFRRDEVAARQMSVKDLYAFQPGAQEKMARFVPERLPVEKEEDRITLLQIPAAEFFRAVPDLDTLAYLAHCREDGEWKGVLFANRVPKPDSGAAEYSAYLLSLEGLADFIGKKEAGSACRIWVPALYHWDFTSIADGRTGFVEEAKKLCETDPGKYWLRIPWEPGSPAAEAGREIQERLSHGYCPLPYHCRTGEESFAWYRGPFLPCESDETVPLLASPDEAAVYDPSWGVFDLSLSCAFETGRLIALADQGFFSILEDLFQRFEEMSQELSRYLAAEGLDHVGGPQAKSWFETRGRAALDFLESPVFTGIGKTPRFENPVCLREPEKPKEPSTVQTAAAQEAVFSLLDTEGALSWLRELAWLQGVPPGCLVPNPAMLPEESLRFFYIGTGWRSALIDGALHAGDGWMENSRFCELVKERLELKPGFGFLVNSRMVSDWPAFPVRTLSGQQPVRRTLLAPDILLCMFEGEPSGLEWLEPHDAVCLNPEKFLAGDRIVVDQTVRSKWTPASFAAEMIHFRRSLTFYVGGKENGGK